MSENFEEKNNVLGENEEVTETDDFENYEEIYHEPEEEVSEEAPIVVPEEAPTVTPPVKNKKSTVITALCIGVCSLIILSCGAHFLFSHFNKGQEAGNTPKEKEQYELYVNPFEMGLYPKYNSTTYPEGFNESFQKLYSMSNYTVGWLSIPNLNIDYPVFQAKNNDYYIKTTVYGVNDGYGSLFADYKCKFGVDTFSKNTVIYGHHMKNKMIFANLMDYKTIEGYKKSPVITFNTIYGDYKWKVFATFTTTAYSSGDNGYIFNYFFPNMSEASTVGYLEALKLRQFYFTDVDVLPTDKFLTLSTCCYDYNYSGKTVKARMVVVARLLREGESEEVDTSKVTYNNNRYEPQAYYDARGKSNPWPAQTWRPTEN